MGIVRGLGSHVGVEFAEEIHTTGDYPFNTTLGVFYRIPLFSDTFHLERDQFSDVNEIGTTGGRETIEFGRSLVRGEFTVLPRYDAIWFNILLAQAMGGESVVPNKFINIAESVTTGANTHAFYFPTTIPRGITIRVYKSGAGAFGLLETYAGCLVTGFTFEQPEGDVARMTFRFVGHSVVHTAAGGPPGALEGIVPMLPRDVVFEAGVRADVDIRTGPGLEYPAAQPFPLNSFTLEVDRKVAPTDAFITSPDALDKPGIEEIRDVTLRIETKLEAKDPDLTADDNYPYFEFINNIQSSASILMQSKTLAVVKNYAFRIDIPAMFWESAEAPIPDGGAVPLTANARAIVGSLTSRGHSGVPNVDTDLRLMTFVKDTDEVITDTQFSHVNSGVQ